MHEGVTMGLYSGNSAYSIGNADYAPSANAFGHIGDVSGFTFGDEGIEDDDLESVIGTKESTGRWTREEHLAFVKGLELYGKGWKKIASLIQTRTVVQIRTHAQKYFLKLNKARQNGDRHLFGLGGKGRKRRNHPLALPPQIEPFFVRKELMLPFDSNSSSSSSGSSTCSSSSRSGSIVSDDRSKTSSPTTVPSSCGSGSGSGSSSGSNSGNTSSRSSDAGSEEIQVALPPPQPPKQQVPPQQRHVDAESGLYNFLSPMLGPEPVGDAHAQLSSLDVASVTSWRTVPKWYARGFHVDALLRAAESVDWRTDSGEAIPRARVTSPRPLPVVATVAPSAATAMPAPVALVKQESSQQYVAQTGAAVLPWNIAAAAAQKLAAQPGQPASAVAAAAAADEAALSAQQQEKPMALNLKDPHATVGRSSSQVSMGSSPGRTDNEDFDSRCHSRKSSPPPSDDGESNVNSSNILSEHEVKKTAELESAQEMHVDEKIKREPAAVARGEKKRKQQDQQQIVEKSSIAISSEGATTRSSARRRPNN